MDERNQETSEAKEKLDTLTPMTLKEAVTYSNKKIVKQCGDGLMKDIMKACIGWFIKLAYGEGFSIAKAGRQTWEADSQMDLFSVKDGEVTE